MFTAPESPDAASLGTKIGEIIEGSGVRVLDTVGETVDLGRTGYRHFS
jgi:hypothetical protein